MTNALPTDLVARWAVSGAMALTGRPDGPGLGPPAGLVPGLERLARPFPDVDPLALITERAAIAGLIRRGRESCGRSCRLLPTADDWLAISLPRPEDVELVPAWLEVRPSQGGASPGAEPPWPAIAAAVAHRPAEEVVDRGTMLGLAVAAVGTAAVRDPVVGTVFGAAPPTGGLLGRRLTGPGQPDGLSPLVVVDLSALWAGPLCGALLAGAGATVVKVEATGRPDGARFGPSAFFDRLNASKRSVALDLTTSTGISALQRLIAQADLVIESSRPRALRQLGIDAAAILAGASTGPRIWVSITGHGRDDDPGRIGFGDDAAAAGGLVVDDGTGPLFCADAVADPCAGLAAAGACIDALAADGRWLLDVSMSAVAASLAGPTLGLPPGLSASAPKPPNASTPAPSLGADTSAVLAELDEPDVRP